MPANEKIVARREEMGITDVEAAKGIDMGLDAYCDVEWHEDEIYTCVDLEHIKKICDFFKFDFFELFDMKCAFCEKGRPYLDEYLLPRNLLMKKCREESEMDFESYGDAINITDMGIREFENDPKEFEIYTFDQIKDMVSVVDVPIQLLLDVKCSKCGR